MAYVHNFVVGEGLDEIRDMCVKIRCGESRIVGESLAKEEVEVITDLNVGFAHGGQLLRDAQSTEVLKE